jgi:hypothetical protein
MRDQRLVIVVEHVDRGGGLVADFSSTARLDRIRWPTTEERWRNPVSGVPKSASVQGSANSCFSIDEFRPMQVIQRPQWSKRALAIMHLLRTRDCGRTWRTKRNTPNGATGAANATFPLALPTLDDFCRRRWLRLDCFRRISPRMICANWIKPSSVPTCDQNTKRLSCQSLIGGVDAAKENIFIEAGRGVGFTAGSPPRPLTQ